MRIDHWATTQDNEQRANKGFEGDSELQSNRYELDSRLALRSLDDIWVDVTAVRPILSIILNAGALRSSSADIYTITVKMRLTSDLYAYINVFEPPARP